MNISEARNFINRLIEEYFIKQKLGRLPDETPFLFHPPIEDGNVPQVVVDARNFYRPYFDDRDIGGTSILHIPYQQQAIIYLVSVTTDGDDGWLEAYYHDGTFIGAAGRFLDLVQWDNRDSIRSLVADPGVYMHPDIDTSETIWNWERERLEARLQELTQPPKENTMVTQSSQNLVTQVARHYGDVEVRLPGLKLGTGTGDRALSTLIDHLGLDEGDITGEEGSYAVYGNLDPAVYKLTWTKEGDDRDKVYAYNGRAIVELTGGTATIEIPYGYLNLIAVDTETKTGTTDFTFTDFKKVGELDFVPEVLNLKERTIAIEGRGEALTTYLYVSTGTGDYATSTLSNRMGWGSDLLEEYGVEGSIARINVKPGKYQFVYKIRSYDPQRDTFLVWNGKEFASYEPELKAATSARYESAKLTGEVEVTGNEIAFIILDTEEKTGTTEARIYRVERTGDPEGMAEGSMYPAHIRVVKSATDMGLMALNSYRHRIVGADNSVIDTNTVPEYALQSWQDLWADGYNWYWHHLSPDGEENGLLNQETIDSFPDAIASDIELQIAFYQNLGAAGKQFLKIFDKWKDMYDDLDGRLAQTTPESIAKGKGLLTSLYHLTGEMGLTNNVDRRILDVDIPNSYQAIDTMMAEAEAEADVDALAHLFTWLAEHQGDYNLMPPEFKDDTFLNIIYSLWRDSWGLD